MKKVVAIDFDDVLFDCNVALSKFHNHHYGTSYNKNDIRSWHLSELWGCTEEEAVRRLNEFVQTDFHHDANQVAGADRALTLLNERGYTPVIVTARTEDSMPQTVSWLEKNMPNLYSAIHFTNYFHSDPSKKKTKSEICLELDALVLVEDGTHNATDAASKNIPVLLFDTPWNQEKMQEEETGIVTRIHSWDDAIAHIIKTWS